MALVKEPRPVDKHVGGRVRMQRMILGMSQEKLGDALGLTFQQVQKYEKGTNRIGASRLQQISNVLGVPVEFFFEGAPGATGGNKSNTSSIFINEFLSSSDGLSLAQAFSRIESPRLRKLIVALAEGIETVQAKPRIAAKGKTMFAEGARK